MKAGGLDDPEHSKKEPTYRRHFPSSRFSIVFYSDFSANHVHRFACSSRFFSSIGHSFSRGMNASARGIPSRRVFATSFPSLTFYLDFFLFVRFNSSRTIPRTIPRRDFSWYCEIFKICFVLRLSFQDDESRESNHKCDSTVDYARKITSDGPSTVTSIECMHSKCIGA